MPPLKGSWNYKSSVTKAMKGVAKVLKGVAKAVTAIYISQESSLRSFEEN